MTKLEEIINFAVERGWDTSELIASPDFFTEEDAKWLIFNIDFLKAFFGEEEMENQLYMQIAAEYCPLLQFSWQYHGQQLVTEEDRIDYLYQYMKGEK